MSKRTLARIVPLSSITLVLSSLGACGAPALAGYGSPIVERGHVVLGIVTRQFTRDIFDEEEDALSNPSDTFGYTALEGVMGLYRNRLDVGFELGRSENDQDRFPDRDYITWDYALKARGLLYIPSDQRFELIGGLAYHESTDFDRSPSQTHKLEQNFVAHVTIGRNLEWQERWIRVYAGGIYSSHEFTEYGDSASPSGRAAEGETRSNLLLLLGVSARIVSAVEASAEIEAREDVSWSLAAGYRF